MEVTVVIPFARVARAACQGNGLSRYLRVHLPVQLLQADTGVRPRCDGRGKYLPVADVLSSTFETRALQLEGKVKRTIQIFAILFLKVVEVLQGEDAPFVKVVIRKARPILAFFATVLRMAAETVTMAGSLKK